MSAREQGAATATSGLHDDEVVGGGGSSSSNSCSKRVAHTLVVALDKDSERLLELTLQPAHGVAGEVDGGARAAAAAAMTSMSEWLLLHMLPVTLGLAHALLRLVEAHDAAVADMANATTSATVSTLQQPQPSCHDVTVTEGDDEYVHAACNVATTTPTTTTSLPGQSPSALEVVRVCVVRGEVHAYALLMKCRTAAHAVALRHTLERSISDAPGVVVAVDHVCEDGRLLSTHNNNNSGSGSNSSNNNNTASEDTTLTTTAGTAAAGTATSVVALWDVVTASLDNSPPHVAQRRQHWRMTHASASATSTPLQQQQQQLSSSPPLQQQQQQLLLPPPATALPAQLRDEACAICQVEPLASQACVVTLCQHRFHLTCYAQLPTTSADCPLCRFSLYELLSDTRCALCQTCEDLWECMICGLVACGRGRKNHQQAHHDATGHSCALQSSTHRIWCYRTRSFMHQDIALLLDRVSGRQQQQQQQEQQQQQSSLSSSSHAATTGAAAKATMAALSSSSASWWRAAEADDKDGDEDDDNEDDAAALRAALSASVEDAVRDYYMAALRALLAEQQAWHAQAMSLSAPHATAAMQQAHDNDDDEADDADADAATMCTLRVQRTTAALVRAEHDARVRLVHEYVTQTRELLTRDQLQLRSALRQQSAAREELQEQVLLESHANNALRLRINRLQQSLTTAAARAQHVDTARRREAELQAKVAALLDQYS